MELMRQSTDTTLFAWGGCHDPSDDEGNQAPLSQLYYQYHNPDSPNIFLFAPSLTPHDPHAHPKTEKLNPTLMRDRPSRLPALARESRPGSQTVSVTRLVPMCEKVWGIRLPPPDVRTNAKRIKRRS